MPADQEPSSVMTVNVRKLLEFFDEAPKASEGDATALAAVLGEDLSAALDITWNGKGWEGESHDRSNFGWVKDHPKTPAGESWNFVIPKTDRLKRGFFQVQERRQPKRYEDGGIIFFFSRNNQTSKNYIVGIYARARYVGKKRFHNIEAPSMYCLRFYNYLEFRPWRHLLPGRRRIPQVGYTYINKRNAQTLLQDALRCNSQINGIEEDANPRSDYRKLERIAKSYFENIDIPRIQVEDSGQTSLADFVRKEFPNFTSDKRITITKDNDKLRRSYTRHQDLLNRAVEFLKNKDWRRPRVSSNADLLAMKRGTLMVLEAKSINSENMRSQIRTGISQLYEYSLGLRKKGFERQRLVLLLEKEPDRFTFEYCDYCEVDLWYKENKVIICTQPFTPIMHHNA